MTSPKPIAIVGGGPAGLHAAEVLVTCGHPIALYDHKASVGRKFLVAGRGGLNLTHSEPLETFITRYGDTSAVWESLLTDFSPTTLRAWVESFAIETYVGTSGRIFPRGQQAAPLLRRWVQRLKKLSVHFHLNHRLTHLDVSDGVRLDFAVGPEKTPVSHHPRATLLALGGASWPQTGSDAAWCQLLRDQGIQITPFTSANCGWECDWPGSVLAAVEGQPLKNITVRAGDHTVAGELLITAYGLEGGALYQLGRTLRTLPSPRLFLDFKPTFTTDQLIAKMARTRRANLLKQARHLWKLSDAADALLEIHGPYADIPSLAQRTKNYEIPLKQPRPIAEAISSAGGIAWKELDDQLMLKKIPGLFVAGEMIDWEAPTGGYLLQGCFATGHRAALGLARWINRPA